MSPTFLPISRNAVCAFRMDWIIRGGVSGRDTVTLTRLERRSRKPPFVANPKYGEPMILRQILPVIVAMLLSACSAQPPPMARNLATRDTSHFDERVRQRFPVGSDENRLEAELRNERFSIAEIHDPANRYQMSARHEVNSMICREDWTILWSAEEGKITGIEGRIQDTCL